MPVEEGCVLIGGRATVEVNVIVTWRTRVEGTAGDNGRSGAVRERRLFGEVGIRLTDVGFPVPGSGQVEGNEVVV